MPAFDAWADIYDLIHRGLPGEAEFYVAQAVRIGGHTLELGCGTGRIALAMALSGVDVTGLDDSEPMLDVCREKLALLGEVPGRVQLVLADMREFDLGRCFELVVMPYRSFMHMLSHDDQRSCLDAVRRHLAPGGSFILNVWDARPSALAPHVGAAAGALQFAARHRLDDEGELLHYRATRCHELEQLMEEEHLVHELDGEGHVLHSQALGMKRCWFTFRELGNLLALSGFEVEAVFGDFDCNPCTDRTSEMIWALRLP